METVRHPSSSRFASLRGYRKPESTTTASSSSMLLRSKSWKTKRAASRKKVAPSHSGSSSISTRESLPKPWVCHKKAAQMYPLLEVGEELVDLSNLLASRPTAKRSAFKKPDSTSSSKQKKKPRRRLYPTDFFVAAIDVDQLMERTLKQTSHSSRRDVEDNRKPPPVPTASCVRRESSTHYKSTAARGLMTSSDHDTKMAARPAIAGGASRPGAYAATSTSSSCVATESKAAAARASAVEQKVAASGPATIPASATRAAPMQIEIQPGVFQILRGSQETWNAIEQGFSQSLQCWICETSLLCIADASYVLCPECKSVSGTNMGEENGGHGVGLGLKV